MKRRAAPWLSEVEGSLLMVCFTLGFTYVGRWLSVTGRALGSVLPTGFWTPPWWAATLLMMEVVDLTLVQYVAARERLAGVHVQVAGILPYVPRGLMARLVAILAGTLGASVAHWSMTGRLW